jgi:hypothetical protein
MTIRKAWISFSESKFLSLFYVGLSILFLSAGFGLQFYSGSLPIVHILGLGGALISAGKAARIIAGHYFNAPQYRSSQALSQFCTLVIVNLLAFWSLCSYFFIEGTMFHDTQTFYNNFHDNLQSLNYFGEPAWWYPNVQHGFPGYFLSILVNVNVLSPPFVILGSVFFFLGKASIFVTDIFPVYVWYFGFIIPFIFSISIWLLVRQILTSSIAIIYVCIVGAVSPGLILNFTDAGLIEIASYGFLFAAAYLKFIKTPLRKNFLIFMLALGVLCVTLGYAFLAFAFLFLIAFFLVQFLPQSSAGVVKSALLTISKKSWFALILFIGICAAPPLLTMSQRGDLERTTLAENHSPYQFMTRGIGNPFEGVMASIPGIGLRGVEGGVLSPFMDGGDGWSLYSYLGLLTIPLAMIGLMHSRSYWRVRLLVLIVLYFSVIILQNYSPLFFPILSFNTLLTSVSHFNDLSYRSGGFILILIAAGLGLEALHEGRTPRFTAPILLLVSLLIVATTLLSLKTTSLFVFGFLLGFTGLLGFAYYIVLYWLGKTSIGHPNQKLFFGLLLAMTVIDVLTISHLHVRTGLFQNFSGIQKTHESLDIQNHDHVGLKNIYTNAQATTTLQARTYLDLQKNGIDIDALPEQALFRNFHASDNISQPDIEAALAGKSLALSQGSTGSASLKNLNASQLGDGISTMIMKTEKNYNSIVFSVTTDQPSLLFVRDARHPYWHAEVDGKPTDVLTALGHYKAVVVPSGTSAVRFWFKPRGIVLSIGVAYAAIIILLLGVIYETMRTCKTVRFI